MKYNKLLNNEACYIFQFHDEIMQILIIITITVSLILGLIIYLFVMKHWNTENETFVINYLRHIYIKIPLDYKKHNKSLELIWTFIPLLVIIYILISSFFLLYKNNENILLNTKQNKIILKIKGHQWYWSYNLHYIDQKYLKKMFNIKKQFISFIYEYKVKLPFFILETTFPKNHSKWKYIWDTHFRYDFDSYMDSSKELRKKKLDFEQVNNTRGVKPSLKQIRLLDVDNPLYLPINTPITLLITSQDVIHSWSIPSLGIKVDAIPGRLNQQTFIIDNIGIYRGQCYELCGTYHGFMPIVIKAIPEKIFKGFHLFINKNADLFGDTYFFAHTLGKRSKKSWILWNHSSPINTDLMKIKDPITGPPKIIKKVKLKCYQR